MRLSISLFFRIIITVSEFSVHGKKSVIEPVIERTNVLINQGYQFILEHWKDLSAILITVIIIRIIRLLIRRRNEKKAYLKEQEQANQLQRNEALNNEILNPDRRPGDVREQKHAYRVEYSENGRASGGRGGRSSGGRASGGIFPGVKKSRGPAEGSLLKVTEYSSFSKSSYMFKDGEIMRVGNQYGNTCILAGDPADSDLYFEIIPHNNQFYVKYGGSGKVSVSRKGSGIELGTAPVELREGDRISVNDRIYEIGFFRK